MDKNTPFRARDSKEFHWLTGETVQTKNTGFTAYFTGTQAVEVRAEACGGLQLRASPSSRSDAHWLQESACTETCPEASSYHLEERPLEGAYLWALQRQLVSKINFLSEYQIFTNIKQKIRL